MLIRVKPYARRNLGTGRVVDGGESFFVELRGNI